MSNEDLKRACCEYMARGGNYSAEPITILSAISRDVNLLLRHFFAVAVYGCRRILLPFPTPANIKREYLMLRDAVRIITPLLLNERPNPAVRGVLRVSAFLF